MLDLLQQYIYMKKEKIKMKNEKSHENLKICLHFFKSNYSKSQKSWSVETWGIFSQRNHDRMNF